VVFEGKRGSMRLNDCFQVSVSALQILLFLPLAYVAQTNNDHTDKGARTGRKERQVKHLGRR